MKPIGAGAALLALSAFAAVPQDPSKERLKASLKDLNLVGTWIYDDIDAGLAEAKKTGKPLMVVLRCVP